MVPYGALPASAFVAKLTAANLAASIPSGSQCLDQLLGGGLCSGTLIEVFGTTGSGKTHLCLRTALSCTLNCRGSVLYIDSGSNFSATRLQELSGSLRDASVNNKYTSDIRCKHIHDLYACIGFFEDLRDVLDGRSTPATEVSPFFLKLQLIVVDCISQLVGPSLGKNPNGHALMTYLARLLRQLAHDHHIIVLVTNGVVGEGTRAALGPSWAIYPDTRLLLRDRTATLVKTPNKPAFTAVSID